MSAILDRFCRYVRINTQAQDGSGKYPSSPGQWELAKLLVQELHEMKAFDVEITEHAIVYATIPATVIHETPTIAWLAHMDTSPEFSGANVQPTIHSNYQGGDIVLKEVDETTGIVTVNLVGACGTCPASDQTLKAGIERIMRDRVDGVTEVVAV